MQKEIEEVLARYDLSGRVLKAEPFGNGHINSTVLVEQEGGPCLVLQRINTYVFKDPELLMANMAAVTEHIRGKLRQEGLAPERRVLQLIPTKSGESFTRDSQGGVLAPDALCGGFSGL